MLLQRRSGISQEASLQVPSIRWIAWHTLLFEGIGGEYNIELTANAKSVREFDDGLTRVSFGYKSVDDYYLDASSSHSIEHVQTPLLCIQVVLSFSKTNCNMVLLNNDIFVCVLWPQASNDPIAPSRGIPREQIRVAISVGSLEMKLHLDVPGRTLLSWNFLNTFKKIKLTVPSMEQKVLSLAKRLWK
ncbi:Embryogenesis-associated protein [Nymphaea thermarum]|nr:Embryogenesis-associated protein [Nymphaea thermarum]